MDLRVLSYNIWIGGGDRLPIITRVISSCQPDVAALLEVDAAATAIAVGHDVDMEPIFGEGNGTFHVAWLSRMAVHRCENHRVPALSKTLLEIDIPWDGESVRLFATHLASRHDRMTPADELAIIVELLTPLRVRDVPHLLVGDFNSLTPDEPIGPVPARTPLRGEAIPGAARAAIPVLHDAGYVDCYRAKHPKAPGYTYRANAPWLRIDYIFASPALAERLADCWVVAGGEAMTASDHLPIVAVFR